MIHNQGGNNMGDANLLKNLIMYLVILIVGIGGLVWTIGCLLIWRRNKFVKNVVMLGAAMIMTGSGVSGLLDMEQAHMIQVAGSAASIV